MANLSDLIEAFLLRTLGEDDTLQISRNELANYFSVAPSQINYVLSTRFTPDRGYSVESRRGGGGCVTVVRIHSSGSQIVSDVMHMPVSQGISYAKACSIADRLTENGIVSAREGRLIKAALSDKALIMPSIADKDALRAGILKNILIEALKCDAAKADTSDADGGAKVRSGKIKNDNEKEDL